MPIEISIETEPMRYKAYRTEDGMVRYLNVNQCVGLDNWLPFTTLFFYYSAHPVLMELAESVFPPLDEEPQDPGDG